MGSQGGVQRGEPLWQPCLPPGRGVWGRSPQFPKGGRVGIKDICLIGTMLVEKTSASLNSYLRQPALDHHERSCYYAPMHTPADPSPTIPSLPEEPPNPCSKTPQTTSSAVHFRPKSVPGIAPGCPMPHIRNSAEWSILKRFSRPPRRPPTTWEAPRAPRFAAPGAPAPTPPLPPAPPLPPPPSASRSSPTRTLRSRPGTGRPAPLSP